MRKHKPMSHKYNFNESFFEKIETEEQAYILGFLYADGSITKRTVKIVQRVIDEDIIEKIKNAINSNHPLVYSTNIGGSGKETKILECKIYSTKMVDDLTSNGCAQNKSMVIRFPFFIDRKLYRHFVRGYFDGDGCVWCGKRKKMAVKDSTRKTGFRERVVQNVKFHITSNIDFITDLQKVLNEDIGLPINKLVFRWKERSPRVATIEYCGRKNLYKFYNYIYSDSTIYGSRKKSKFEEIFCALSEKSLCELGLIAGKPLET